MSDEVVRFEISKLDVKRGDIVVMRVDDSCARSRFHREISEAFPDLRFMVLPQDIELSVLAPVAVERDAIIHPPHTFLPGIEGSDGTLS